METQITERALIARINRKLQRKNFPERLCKSREGSSMQNNMGDYYIVDVYRNTVVDYRVNLEEYGRAMGVIE